MTADFRLISATHTDLARAVEQRDFRQDFYYRINVITIVVPPLRERREDIELLAVHFLEGFCQEFNKHVRGISKEALEMMTRYDWPGNVRELENVIERAVVIGKRQKITPSDLPFQEVGTARKPAAGSLREVEKSHISEMLAACEWNIAQTASLLGINRTTLYKKIKKYGLKQPSS
jgi:DNA-binding NtrC family response regulator